VVLSSCWQHGSVPQLLQIAVSQQIHWSINQTADQLAESPTCQSEDGDNFSAIGLGVSNLDASTRFYTAVFDYRNATRLDLPNWTEDILLSNGNATGSYAIVTMRWKEAQPRNVRDLPIKLRFKVPDPRATQRLVARSGGKSLPLHYNHGDPHSKAVYATDPDGYLIELLPAGGHGSGTGLVSAGLGTSNLEASAGFWGAVTGNAATTIKGTRRWRSITINPDTDSGRTALELLDWKERPARPTDRLPIKVVVRTRSAAAFVSRVVQAGGQVVLPPGPMQGIVVGFCRDPVDQTLIEINEFPSF
jgi:catechol 2,3-dioxygenase-like lactoylglutathione lyase family enzyme